MKLKSLSKSLLNIRRLLDYYSELTTLWELYLTLKMPENIKEYGNEQMDNVVAEWTFEIWKQTKQVWNLFVDKSSFCAVIFQHQVVKR